MPFAANPADASLYSKARKVRQDDVIGPFAVKFEQIDFGETSKHLRDFFEMAAFISSECNSGI